MDAMAKQLRQTYQEKDTEELVEMASKNSLTDTAYAVLDEILAERGADLESVRSLRAKNTEKELVEEKSLSNLASIPKRFAAKFIDTFGIVILIGIPLITLGGNPPDDSFSKAAFLVIFWAYFLLSDGMFGQGVGKRLMKIKVVKYGTNKSCTFGQSFWRNLSAIFLFDWFFALGKKQMRLGDMIASTQVVNAK